MNRCLATTLACTGFLAFCSHSATASSFGFSSIFLGATQPPSFLERLWFFLGVLHPIIVHFPIALLLVAAAMEALRFKIKTISADVVYYCLVIGALGAVPSIIFGWARATGFDENNQTLFLHRWLGVAVTVLALSTAIIATLVRIKKNPGVLKQVQVAGVFIAGGLVGFVGHLGGELTYGPEVVENALINVFNPPAPKIDPPVITKRDLNTSTDTAQSGVATSTQSPTNDTAATASLPNKPDVTEVRKVDFTTQVWPIINSKCISCHGSRKVKAGLRLDSEEAALKGGRSGQPAYIKGNSKESLIVKVIVSDDDDEKMPPPGEGKVVTHAEHDIIVAWIDQGAEWNLLPGTATAEK